MRLVRFLLLTLVFSTQPALARTGIEIAFSPNQGAEELVLTTIDSATKSIRLAAYSFTSKPVVEALLRAKKRGVDVRLILDDSNTKQRPGIVAANIVTNAGIPVRIDSRHAIAHSKYIVVDGVTVETGSFNYSASAADRNAENVIVLWQNPDAATTYLADWESHWQHASPYTPAY